MIGNLARPCEQTENKAMEQTDHRRRRTSRGPDLNESYTLTMSEARKHQTIQLPVACNMSMQISRHCRRGDGFPIRLIRAIGRTLRRGGTRKLGLALEAFQLFLADRGPRRGHSLHRLLFSAWARFSARVGARLHRPSGHLAASSWFLFTHNVLLVVIPSFTCIQRLH